MNRNADDDSRTYPIICLYIITVLLNVYSKLLRPSSVSLIKIIFLPILQIIQPVLLVLIGCINSNSIYFRYRY